MSIRRSGLILLAVWLFGALARPGAAQQGSPPVYNPANGHWYQVVTPAGPVSWQQARDAAAALSYAGFAGHLATVTSLAENQFLWDSVIQHNPSHSDYLLGGYQDKSAPDYSEPAGGWRWVTGEPWVFTYWAPGEPNNTAGVEDVLGYWSPQLDHWNDFNPAPRVVPFIVEYEPPFSSVLLTQMTITPNPVAGGQTASGQVLLSQPAGAGGVIVSLTSSNPAAAVVPAVVTVPAGTLTVAFPITTFPVAASTPVTISAGSAAGSASATLLVTASGAPTPNPQLPPGHQAAGPPVYDPANGHWYQAVRAAGGITWDEARAAAQAMTYAGYPGHLVTITSADENQFILTGLPLSAEILWWIGAYQDKNAPDYSEPAGGWRWVTGEPWSFTFWTPNAPDNFQGNQDNVDLDAGWGFHWDDRNGGDRLVGGYLVEYEPPAVPAPPSPRFGPLQILLFPNPVPGGLLALGQVTLPQPAGAGGAIVSLTSSNPAVAVVPSAVTILPGAGAATFPIITFPVAAPASVTISAGGAGGSAAATLQVLPLSAPAPPPVTTNLLVNGSFEQPPGGDRFGVSGGVPGWRIVKGDIDIVTASYWQAAPDGGNQSIDLDGFHVGTIEQSFPTVPGLDYVFSGYVSHNPSVPYGRANVSLNGQFLTQLAHDIPNRNPDMQWQRFSYRFRTTAAATTLTISDVTGINDSQGTVLDALSVTLAPDQNPPPVAAGADLPAPTNLSARLLPGQGVQLSWQDNSRDEDAFAVWRRSDSDDWKRIALLPPNSTTFLDRDVAPGLTYTYLVRATRGHVASAWSNEARVTAALQINGITYAPSGPQETLAATFTQPDGGVTVNAYRGYVLLHVTGVGQSYGTVYNDAFYLYTGPFNPPQNAHDGGYYQLAFGAGPLAAFDAGNDATNFLVGPLPPYNPAHDYTFALNTRLSSPGHLHFGVSDGGFSDNTGAYTITVTQLVAPASV